MYRCISQLYGTADLSLSRNVLRGSRERQVDVKMLNAGAFDYVNTMSYHWNRDGNLWSWQKDAWFATKLWGIDPARVNLGVGDFSELPGSNNQPLWRDLSPQCPNAPARANVCNGTVFVGKAMNWELGGLARSLKLGGVFPWQFSYDDLAGSGRNNSLLPFLVRGLEGKPMEG